MGTAGSTSQRPAGRGGSNGQESRGGRSATAARRPHRSAGGSGLLARVQRLPRARQPAGPGSARGEKSAAVETVTTPSFELVQTWLSAPPRLFGPGTPTRRFPPSAASAPSRPPAGSRHPTQPAPRPPPGLQRPRVPARLPARLPAAFLRGAVHSAKEQRNGAALPLGGRVPQRPPAPARTRRPPGPAESRGRLCVGLARRLRARRAL